MDNELNTKRGEKGFTLVEMMVVIVILGILAAIVVFAVSGLGDRGQAASCKTDAQVLISAEEATYAKTGSYDTMANLQSNGFLHAASTLHTIGLTGTPPAATAYALTPVAPCTVTTG